ncbi:MAG TPA: NADPH-dependent F420 reductase [Vicinamibacterales bacterium]|nr:NADPH-dependent F420 reductase [Vicinamibacterales bacterium]
MKIALIGAGMIGGTLARLLAALGHEVAVSNRRGPQSLHQMTTELGGRAHAMTVEEAARWGEVVVLAVPWRSHDALPSPESVAGKVVIDAMNPYRAWGGTYDLDDSTSSEETQKRLPGARLVKAFNTIYFRHLATEGRTDLPEDDRRAIFVASDDAEAKAGVAALIRELGFAAVDAGTLRDGRKLQPGSAVYNQQLTGREAAARLASIA